MNIDIIMDTLVAMFRRTKDSKEKIALQAVVQILRCVGLIGYNLSSIKEVTEWVEKELCEKEKEENNE